jgi:hypothetical protein
VEADRKPVSSCPTRWQEWRRPWKQIEQQQNQRPGLSSPCLARADIWVLGSWACPCLSKN